MGNSNEKCRIISQNSTDLLRIRSETNTEQKN